MADSVRRKSRSKERSRSRTTNKNKISKREHSIWSNSSDASESNVSVKRKSTSCSKDKRRKSRRYSRSSSSSSSSSSTSSSSSPRKDNLNKSSKSYKKSSDHEVDKLSERKLNERSIHEPRKIIKDKKSSRSRSRSVQKNDYDRPKSSSHRRQTESYYREGRNDRSTSKDHQRSERDKLTIRTRDYYGNPYNSGVIKSSEEYPDHGKSNRVSISRIRTERDQESLKNNERNSVSSVNYEGIKAAKKTEDLSVKRKSKGSRDRSISSSRNTGKKSKKKRSTSSSSSTSTSSSSSDDSKAEKARKKRKKIAARKLKKAEKKQRKKEKKLKKKLKKIKPKPPIKEEKTIPLDRSSSNDRLLNDIPMEVIERAKAMAPMTKEQWEKKQSIIRRVYDEETGRHRLIKGGGEVLEEIVSRERHREINRQATRGDGEFFQSQLRLSK